MLNSVIKYLESIDPVTGALYATTFTWLVTALGASLVFFVKKMNRSFVDAMLGFTGGVMIAASVWSLLIPAIDMSEGTGFQQVYPAVLGFLGGALFLHILDKILPHMHANFKQVEGIKTPWQTSVLLILAITLHNIPEGLAVGVLFGGASAEVQSTTVSNAVSLALGIGLQNFPEGIAVALPLLGLGLSKRKSFFLGQASALVEPASGVLGAYAVSVFSPILPYALAFAAGAMVFVVIEEVIPESQQNKKTNMSTIGFIGGFLVMMTLDVALG